MTTFRVGGARRVVPGNADERGNPDGAAPSPCRRNARDAAGGGSNVLVSDAGVRGLVVRPRGGTITRLQSFEGPSDAAVTINGLVRWTITHGAAGLEAWAGHARCGGGRRVRQRPLRRAADWRPDHGGRVVGPRRNDCRLSCCAMEFGYDRSRLQDSGEVLLSATFRVEPGDPRRCAARRVNRSRIEAHAAAGYAERRMHLSKSAAGS